VCVKVDYKLSTVCEKWEKSDNFGDLGGFLTHPVQYKLTKKT